MSYLIFDQHPQLPGAKTKRWAVVAKLSDTLLGNIRWATNFRKYAFFPEPCTQFDAGCLEEISACLRDETTKHYAALKGGLET